MIKIIFLTILFKINQSQKKNIDEIKYYELKKYYYTFCRLLNVIIINGQGSEQLKIIPFLDDNILVYKEIIDKIDLDYNFKQVNSILNYKNVLKFFDLPLVKELVDKKLINYYNDKHFQFFINSYVRILNENILTDWENNNNNLLNFKNLINEIYRSNYTKSYKKDENVILEFKDINLNKFITSSKIKQDKIINQITDLIISNNFVKYKINEEVELYIRDIIFNKVKLECDN